MSYNISRFIVKKIQDFKIPVAMLTSRNTGWEFKRDTCVTGDLAVFEALETTIKGVLEDGILHVKEIECEGEGSGTIMEDVLWPAFENSQGLFEAVRIWEGGDSVNRIRVLDGDIFEEVIEL